MIWGLCVKFCAILKGGEGQWDFVLIVDIRLRVIWSCGIGERVEIYVLGLGRMVDE